LSTKTGKLPSPQDSLDATKHLEEAFAIFYAESQKLEAQQTALQDVQAAIQAYITATYFN